MMIRYLFYLCVFFALNSCSSLKSKQYHEAYDIIINELKNDGTEEYYINALKDINKFGLRIHDSIYFPTDGKRFNKEIFLKINIRKDLKIKKSKIFSNFSHKYENSKWGTYNYYDKLKKKLAFDLSDFKGPTHVLFFSSIDNNVLLADVLQNNPSLYSEKDYSGTVYKFYFLFDGLKIKDSFFVKNHYEPNW